MVAASRYGEGIGLVVMDRANLIISSSAAANKITRIRRGAALFFMLVIIIGGFVFCLKEFLSRFLD